MPHNSTRFWDFKWQNEQAILSEVIASKGNIFDDIISGPFEKSSKQLVASLRSIIDWFRVEDLRWDQVWQYIDTVSSSVQNLLKRSHLFRTKWINIMLDDVRYRSFMYWVVKIIEKSGVKVEKLQPQDVLDDLWKEIFNILGDKALTSLFIVLKSFWLLDYSKNMINKFDEENELKILDINPETLQSQLLEFGAEKVFDWEIQDLYYDYPDRRLDVLEWKKTEKSFRIRKRIDTTNRNPRQEYFYTLKRKKAKPKSKKKPRWAFEKEYKVKWFRQFTDVIEQFWLQAYRAKEKKRISYAIDTETEHIKFDIDFYEGIPPLVEMECDDEKVVEKYIKLLWLWDNKILREWSRWLFKYYGKMDDYIFADNNPTRFKEFVQDFKKAL